MRAKTFGGPQGRIPRICALLERCSVFADIGCDHGYCTLYMLRAGLCDRAIISDISAKSLAKAQKLLSDYAAQGRVTSVCCDGLGGAAEADLVLIAGMGGEEIVSILKRGGIPPRFVLQPMRDGQLVRRFLIGRGCAVDVDDLFREGGDGKFYFVMRGSNVGGTPAYSGEEYAFGRDSLKNPLFGEYIAAEIAKTEGYLKASMSPHNREQLTKRLNFLKGACHEL